MDLFQYPLWLTNPEAILFVGLSIAIMVLLSVYFWIAFYCEKPTVGNRALKLIFKRTYLPYAALIISIVVGLIFSSIKQFQNLYINMADPHLNAEQAWSWQAVSFSCGVGQWIIAIVFALFLWATPAMMYVSIRRIMMEHDSIRFFAKKWLWTVIIVGVTVGVMMLTFVMHFNVNDTSLACFGLSKQLDDGFYYTSRFLFHYAFLTWWYPILFLLYVFFWMMVAWLINYLEMHRGHRIIFDTWVGRVMLKKEFQYGQILGNFPHPKFIANSLFTPMGIFGWMAILDLFSYLTGFILFNAKSPFTHLMFIGNLAIIFVVLMLITFIGGVVKYRKEFKTFFRAYLFTFQIHLFKSIQNHLKVDPVVELWTTERLAKNGQTSLNMCQELVAGISFTIFLGFTNFTSFHTYDQVGISGYSAPFHGAWYWISMLIATFMVNYMFVDIRQQIFLSKISIGEAAYHVTPGMQSGWLNFLSQWVTFNSTIINDQIRLLV